MYRVRTAATGIGGGRWLSTQYFDESGGEPADAHAAVVAFWTALAEVIHTQVSMFVESEVAIVDETNGQTTGIVTVPSTAFSGEDNTSPSSLATQGLIQWITGTFAGGRQIRGRTFVWGVTQDQLLDGRPRTSYRDVLGAAADALVADMDSIAVVWSRTLGTVAVAQTGTGWTEFAVQRSRRD
uniref:Uncharacterized protein n=1 Tax=uncultured prokaryote TaxID=198431 RepID=A0A0H5Q5Y7_9ZZZZ|nr:hypothetical protein [uncultured prokaryote]